MRRMENRMESMENRMRGDMRTQRGEMQSMGLSLQASLDEVRGKMADWRMVPARGGTIESRGSVEGVWTAIETGKVEETSDVTIIGGETEIINEVTEIEEVEEKLHEINDEHTQVEIVRDNGVELVECFMTRCEHQDSLPQEQRERVLRPGEPGRAVRGRAGV